MSSPKRFQNIREINVCHMIMYIRLDKKTKTYLMFAKNYTENGTPKTL